MADFIDALVTVRLRGRQYTKFIARRVGQGVMLAVQQTPGSFVMTAIAASLLAVGGFADLLNVVSSTVFSDSTVNALQSIFYNELFSCGGNHLMAYSNMLCQPTVAHVNRVLVQKSQHHGVAFVFIGPF